jgi:glycosyltransferase involved in cell wall biosynthesis
VVHAHSSVGGALGRLAAALTRRPAVYTPNGLYDSAATLTIERLLGHLTARLVAVSASEAQRVRDLRLVPDDRLVVIPNGIDLASPTRPFDLRPLAAIPPEAPLVAFVGRLIAQKQPLLVVDALHRVLDARPDAYALLIGDGPLRSAVEAAIADHPRMRRLDGVRAVSAGLGSADVVVLLSSFEGAPYIPLEAMLAGTPVVVSDVVGSRDAVALAGGGLIVPDRDPGAAAAALLRLLADDPERARLGADGAAGVRRALGVGAMGQALAETYAAVQRSGVRRSAYSNRPDRDERG